MITQPGRGIAATIVIATLAIIAIVTLQPAEQLFALPTFCIICGPLGGVDFALNIALFVPLGIGLRWLTGRWTASVLIGASTTIIIEALQARLIPGRDASLGDLVANTLGTILGVWLAVAGIRMMNASPATARRLAVAVGAVTASVIVASAMLLVPMDPQGAQYVQWTPLRPNTDPFRGQLVAVDVNGRLIRPREAFPSQWTIDSVTRAISVRAIVRTPIPPSQRQAIVVRIANDFHEGFMLAQRGDAAVFRSSMAATRLKLRPLLVGLDGALSIPDGGTEGVPRVLMVTAISNPRAMGLTREQSDATTDVTLRRTVGLGWALLLPWDIALDPGWWPVNALWLGILVVPITFLTMRSGHKRVVDPHPRLFWWPLTLVLSSLAVVPPIIGLSALGPAEWLGVLTGMATAVLLERWASPPMSKIVSAAAATTPP